MMLRPGRHNFFIFMEDDEGVLQSYYCRHLTNVRKENVPEFAKELKQNKVELDFNFGLSVFNQWRQDNAKVIDDSLAHD